MSEWSRATRECKIDELNPLMMSAIRKRLESYNIDLAKETLIICCETTSVRNVRKLFRSSSEVVKTSVVLTTQWLIWAALKDSSAFSFRCGRLRALTVQDYERSELNGLMPDTGLNISGLQSDTLEPSVLFLGLGTDVSSLKFRELLKTATAAS